MLYATRLWKVGDVYWRLEVVLNALEMPGGYAPCTSLCVEVVAGELRFAEALGGDALYAFLYAGGWVLFALRVGGAEGAWRRCAVCCSVCWRSWRVSSVRWRRWRYLR